MGRGGPSFSFSFAFRFARVLILLQVAVLLNNAAVADVGRSYEGLDKWKAVMDVNLFGYVVLFAART